MRVNVAHVRAPAANGGFIDFVVFEARSNSGLDNDNSDLLAQLTVAARGAGLKVDQSALAFNEHGQLRFFGTKPLVQHLSKTGLPRWNKYLDI
jgi:hypothetical protein